MSETNSFDGPPLFSERFKEDSLYSVEYEFGNQNVTLEIYLKFKIFLIEHLVLKKRQELEDFM